MSMDNCKLGIVLLDTYQWHGRTPFSITGNVKRQNFKRIPCQLLVLIIDTGCYKVGIAK